VAEVMAAVEQALAPEVGRYAARRA
jgi:hypothetical protein